jgi:ABC-2 type transport system permease protein
MDKLFAIIDREFGERVRSKWFILTTLFGPLLFAALLVVPPWIAVRSQMRVDVARVLFVDATGTDLGTNVAVDVAGGLQGTSTPPRVLVVSDAAKAQVVDSLRKELIAGKVPGYLLLDAATLSTGNASLVLKGGESMSLAPRLTAALERQVRRVRLAALGLEPQAVETVVGLKVNVNTERLTADGRQASARVNLIFGFGVAIMLYIAIVLYGQIVLRSVAEEKQTRVAEVVLASVPARSLLAGKIIGIGGVAIVQLGFWTAAMALLMANRGRILSALGVDAISMALPSIGAGDVVLLLAYFLIGFAFYSALFAIVGSIASSEQEAQQAQTPVIMLLVSSVALLQTALADPNGRIAYWLSTLPFSSPIVMPLRLGMTDVPTAELIVSIGVLCLFAVLALLAAGRVYRTALLMYGKRPSLRELSRWLRASD